jgi:nucleotide-binding universal stress UspA family protein
LAKDQHSALRLVHVVDLTLAYSAVEAPYVADYEKAVRAAGKKVIIDCSATVHEAGIEFDTKSIVIDMPNRHIYDAIEEEAKQWPADLLVIGTHGRRGFRRLFLGSVAEGLIRISTKPVLLIRGA